MPGWAWADGGDLAAHEIFFDKIEIYVIIDTNFEIVEFKEIRIQWNEPYLL